MTSKNHFYVTTPIYYATAKPHLGSLYSTVLADVLARFERVQGKRTFFLTGTDEHGQKIATAAAQAGKEPKEFVDSFIPAYKAAWKLYHIEYNRFIRTTDEEHKINVQKLIRKLIAKGDVYKGAYTGWYCVPCETFLTEKESADAAKDVVAKPLCPSCHRATGWVEESTYFFKLSAYQDKLLTFYQENSDFIAPKERAQEVIKFVQAGLKDISISRTEVKWGVPFPDDAEHILYVWIEALCNYITGVGYGQSEKEDDFKTWWPADVQVMAKDIVRFHGVFWPALLMAADLLPPKRLLVHGWIKVNDQKMSKSLGNVVDPVELATLYDPEMIRYFMVRHLAINQDGEFNITALEKAIESDLANDLGNLANRMILLAHKHNHHHLELVSDWQGESTALYRASTTMLAEFTTAMKDFQFHIAYARVWHFIKLTNGYFHEQAPWKVAILNAEKFNEILSTTAHALYTIAIVCWPVMPQAMEKLLASIGHTITFDHNELDMAKNRWTKTFTLTDSGTLFEKPSHKKENLPEEKPTSVESEIQLITIDTFKQCQLRAGTVIQCLTVPKADKLLQLTVSFGQYGKRTILSGIKKWYAPEELVGKQFIFLHNLQPRAMVGLQSEGMILCAPDEQGRPVPVLTQTNVPDGALLG